MFLIAGLGNPGPEYQATRHNVGFRAVELLAARHHAVWRSAALARLARARVMAEDVLFVEPWTFMNRSGEAIAPLLTKHKPRGTVVIYDDVDLPVGRLRVRAGGGAGGHRGVESVIERCGPEFTRVRIGIGRPPASSSTVDFVLGAFAEDEIDTVDAAIGGAAEAVECVLSRGVETAMSFWNGKQYSGGGIRGSAGGERDAKV
jgi:PTH1 family peptidyl-tRNA hydrolase